VEDIIFIISGILLLPALIFAIVAQFRVMGAFNRYSQYSSTSGETGGSVARRLLDQNGCTHVSLELSAGHLSDHYDPRTKTVRLSQDVFHSSSLAALGVAAHEVGHAIQDHTGYAPLRLRNSIIRSTRLVNMLILPLIMIGFLGLFLTPWLISEDFFFWFIIALCVMYGISAVINIITLPTEYDASRRAKRLLEEDGSIRDQEEKEGVASVLNAAALTYVAALVISLVWFMRFLAIAISIGRNR